VRTVGLLAVIALASLLCATIVGWGLHWLGFHPFTVLAPVVLVNNLVAATILAPLLLRVLYPRLAGAQLLYRDVVATRPLRPVVQRAAGVLLLVGATVAAFVAGHLIARGTWRPDWAVLTSTSGGAEVGLGLLPFLVLAVLGLALL
jgi:hypothetical protein